MNLNGQTPSIRVTDFLNTTLKKDDLFFALPYDCLYYYLTGKESPTRQLIFFDHIKIPPQQEISVIKELESNKISLRFNVQPHHFQ